MHIRLTAVQPMGMSRSLLPQSPTCLPAPAPANLLFTKFTFLAVSGYALGLLGCLPRLILIGAEGVFG